MGAATTSRRKPMMAHGGGDDVAPPSATLELDDAKGSAGAWAGGGGSGSVGGGNGDPGVRSLVDLIELLHASENPLWDLIRFEVRHRNILAWQYHVCYHGCLSPCVLGESTRHPLLGQVKR